MPNETVFDALLFGPGLPAGGHRSRVRADAFGLAFTLAGGRTSSVSYSRISATLGGFDHATPLLAWNENGAACSLMPADDAAKRALFATGVEALKEKLAPLSRAHNSIRRGFHFGAGAIAALFALPLVLVALFFLNAERIAGWVADHVSVENENRLGDMAFASMRPQLKLVESGPAPDVVKAVGTRLTRGSRYTYRWHVTEDPTINAFAIPGGVVVVHTGLIRAADSAEELAGVLAHEVQHVELRHSLKNMIHGLGWQAAVSLALGDLSGSVWGNLAAQLGSLKFGRDLETEADVAGLKALKRAGMAPQGMLAFFEKMARKDGGQIALLSSHPASEDRFMRIRGEMKKLGDWHAAPLPYDWASVRASAGN